VLSAGGDNSLNCREPAAGKSLCRIPPQRGYVRTIAISPDGHYGLWGTDDVVVRLWDLRENREIFSFADLERSATATALSADGRRAAVGAGKEILVFDVAGGGQPLRRIKGVPAQVLSLTFFRDADHLLSGGAEDHAVRVWDVSNGSEIRAFVEHAANVERMALSTDGRLLVTGAGDARVKSWDFAWPLEYRRRVAERDEACRVLQRNPRDAAALRTLAGWYEFERVPAWESELIDSCRAAGGDVSSVTAGRACLLSGRRKEAGQEFRRALDAGDVSKELLGHYIRLADKEGLSGDDVMDAVERLFNTPLPLLR
jgi:hypothetical protein